MVVCIPCSVNCLLRLFSSLLYYVLGDDNGIKWHQEFRDAFPDYKVTVKRILVDGSDVVLWNEMNGTHTKEYPYGELQGIAPTNKKVTWTEIWYFDVVDGKKGE